uniref:DDE-1 domain-containing protein n=1 Tax=Rhizophagus irregularis (strain DAOM 181602 / DAOM 197198 / MUCL 43194) TaxID=747089 RepID=U9UAT9_RHIID
MLASNASGNHKLKPLVIGKSLRPRAFYGIQVSRLPVTYKANKKAWMRNDIFNGWVSELDREFRLQGRHVVLIIDNAASHKFVISSDENDEIDDCDSDDDYDDDYNDDNDDYSDDDENDFSDESEESSSQNSKRKGDNRGGKKDNLQLTNIQIVFLPPNTTSKLQPMDAGIIQNFKVKYKQLYIRHLIEQFEQGFDYRNKLNIKQAIDFVAEAWESVEQKTICNCWNETGIVSISDSEFIQETQDAVRGLGVLVNEIPNIIPTIFIDNYNKVQYDLMNYINDEISPHTKEILNDTQIINLVQNEEVPTTEDNIDNEEELTP